MYLLFFLIYLVTYSASIFHITQEFDQLDFCFPQTELRNLKISFTQHIKTFVRIENNFGN